MTPTAQRLLPGTRIQALDILRGLVIVIMALDHVRDYFHESGWAYDPLDPKFTTPLLFATRWLSHFCAPTFVFLAGVSIWLQFAKGKDSARLSRFILTRGLWIIFLEFTVISFGWAFSIPYLPLLQVMWAIGLSMVALSALVWLPQSVVLGIGIAILALHNTLDSVQAKDLGALSNLWIILHEGGMILQYGKPLAFIAYPVLPWIGLMAFGYGIGSVFLLPNRDQILYRLGAAMLATFAIFRGLQIYGDPLPWATQPDAIKTVMSFLTVQKYPPSLMYVCATLGTVLILIPVLDRWNGPVKEFFQTFGSVPLFSYVGHIYIMHGLAIAVYCAAGRNLDGMFNTIYNMFFKLDAFKGEGFALPWAYLAWMIVIALLYPMSRWWAAVKRRRRDWWLSYL